MFFTNQGGQLIGNGPRFTMAPRTRPNTQLQHQRATNNSMLPKPYNNNNQNQTVPIEQKIKTMRWGEPTWIIFHTLAECGNDAQFGEYRAGLLDIIYTICCNLPCPDCASHAKDYMDRINYSQIQTRSQLREMLFQFHNSVNQRKGYALFNRDGLVKYRNTGLVYALHTFMGYFQDRHASFRMISNDYHRGRLAINLKQWFNANLHYFLV